MKQGGISNLIFLSKLTDQLKTQKTNMSEENLTDFEKALQKKLGDKKVFVCSGSDCTAAGTQKAIKNQLLAYFSENEIGTLNCIGLCYKNHSFRLDGKRYSAPTPEIAQQILEEAGYNKK